MCTWGMAMATQQAVPATQSSTIARPGDRPKGRLRSGPSALAPAAPGATAVAASAGGRARISSASPAMLTKVNRPRPA